MKPGCPSSSRPVLGALGAILTVAFSLVTASAPMAAGAAPAAPKLNGLASQISSALGHQPKEVPIPHNNSQATAESTEAPDLTQLFVQDLDGQSFSVVDIAKGRPTLIVFLRHFG